jgi:tRNA (uracil-5-)-methyltransferase
MNKFELFQVNINHKYPNKFNINLSPSSSFRCRSEFSYKDNHYVMHDKNKKIYMTSFSKASNVIQKVMPELLNEINNSNSIRDKLFQINFRSNKNNNVMVTLIYHKNVESLVDKINAISKKLKIQIILRSKKYFYSTNNIFFEDHLDFQNLKIYQTDNCFYQPNRFLVDKMILTVLDFIESPMDLLELYCGVGTFTLPLSTIFNKVLATESDRNSIKCLFMSLDVNDISNVDHARLSANEVSLLIRGKKFRRMKNNKISDYNFSHILVDPPRSGLTSEVIEIVKDFKNIIYISCNPDTYIRDINLLQNHNISKIELFDQFPNSDHMEIVSILSND